MKKSPLLAVSAAALLAVGVAGAVEKAKTTEVQTQPKTPSAVQMCKDQGKTGKELSECIHAEHDKRNAARRQEREAKTQQAKNNSGASEEAQPVK